MRYLETFNEKNWFTDKVNKYKYNKKIHKICKEYSIENYTINLNGLIDVYGDVILTDKGLTKLPLKFNKANSHFYCNCSF